MNISLNLGAWNSIFAVPCALVDQHIKLAGGAQLKVLLWILRHAGESFSAEDISTSLNMAAPDVKDAMNYWVETGLLTSQEHTLTPSGAAPTPLMVPLETNSFPAESSSPLPIIEESATDSPPIVPAPEPAKMSTAKPKPTGIFLGGAYSAVGRNCFFDAGVPANFRARHFPCPQQHPAVGLR